MKSFMRKFYLLVVTALCCMNIAFAADGTPLGNPAPDAKPLKDFLNTDGSLKNGISGNYDARGFKMSYDKNGSPRFSPNGTGDNYWENGFGFGGINGQIFGLAISGSDIYVGGSFTDAGGIPEADYVAKWDGTQWSALGKGVDRPVEAIAILGTDVYVGGGFQNAIKSDGSNVSGTTGIARWDGTQWSAVGYGTSGGVRAIAISGTDVLVGGSFDYTLSAPSTPVTGTNTIAKWNGSSWSTFNNANIDGELQVITVSGSNVYIGGSFNDAGGVAAADWLARWNGTSWSALGTSVNSSVSAIAVSGSNVYVGGNFTAAGGVANTNKVARWTGSAWAAMGGGVSTTNYPTVNSIVVWGSDVYVGGSFTSVMSNATTYVNYTGGIAKWNGTSWSALQKGLYGNTYDMVVTASGLLVMGNFQASDAVGNYASNTLNIAKWTGSAWVSAGMLQANQNGLNYDVTAIAVSGSDVYVGGYFTDAGGVPGADGIAKWNGTSWSALGTGISGDIKAIAVSASNVYVGGYFSSAGGVPVNNIAKWNGTSWSALGTGIGGGVNAIAASGTDVYVGGSIYSAGALTVNNIAKWNGTTWSALGSGVNSYVYAIAVTGTDIYVGGDFTTAGGVAAQRIAKWNGTSWSPIGTANSGVDNTVRAIAISGTDIYVGGLFYTVYNNNAGFSSYRVAKWDGSKWVSMTDANVGEVYALAVSGSKVFIGSRGGNGRSVVMWNGTDANLLGSGLDYYSTVNGLGIVGNKIYVGGTIDGVYDRSKPIKNFGVFNDFTPTVTTAAATNILFNAATLGGNVVSDGGEAITERGIVWSTNNIKPDITHNKVVIGAGTGTFAETITPFPSGNTIKVRAYAKNAAGLVYGVPVSFTTPTVGAPTITAVSPQSGAVGISVTLAGTNFSTTPSNNIVYFGATRAAVTAATATSLQVTVPVCASYQNISVVNTETNAIGYSLKPFHVTFPSDNEVKAENFASAVEYSVNGATVVEAGDIDGDGKTDLVVAASGNISILRNTSTTGSIDAASFAAPVTIPVTSLNTAKLVVADIDVDGKLDIAFVNSSTYRISILRNTSTPGSITFQDRADFSPPSSSISTLAVADLNGDGKPELLTNYIYCYYTCSYAVAIYRNTSIPGIINTESFAPYTYYSTSYGITDIAVGDLDKDGKADLTLAYSTNMVGILKNNTLINSATFSFTWAPGYTTSGTSYDINLVDVDGDDKLDLVTNNSFNVLRNTSTTGSPSFEPAVTFPAWSNTPFGVNDLDGDGKPDFAVANSTITLFKNLSEPGAFTIASLSAPVLPAASGASYITVTDIDGDARPEIVFTGANKVSVLRNITPPPTPKVTSAATGTVCSNKPQNYTLTCNLSGATFAWTRAAIDGISNAAASGTEANITEALINTTSAPVNVVYEVTATADGKTGPVFNYTVTVNPSPTVSSATTGNICSSTAQNYTITSAVAGTTFTWSRAAVDGISNTAVSAQTANLISEALVNTTAAPVTVTYVITPEANGCTGTPFNYTVTVNPSTAITTQPSAQAVCAGGNVSFSVTATGAGITYQWRKDGVNITDATSSTYTITNVTAALAGNYDVVVTGTCGPVTSAAAALTIKPFTAITTQPTAQVVCAGASATLTVAATGSGTLSYQWKKGGVAISNANSASYTISSATAADAGSYEVVVTGDCGPVASTAVNLTVNAATLISTHPAAQTACAGASATFSVTATGSGLTYQWRKGGAIIPSASGSTYTITNVTASDAANYDVVITGNCGTLTSNAAVLTLNAAPVITSQPTAQVACSGASVTFSVSASGAGLTYQWRKGGVNISNATSASYTTNTVSTADAGSYDVVVTTSCAASLTSTAANLTVNTAPAITTQPTAQVVCAGTSATFSVSATGTGLTYQWRKGGVNISTATSASYTISSVTAGDLGNYDVVVTGTCGTPVTSSAVALSLKAITSISTPPIAKTVCAGAGASFSVAATGEGTLSYQWYKDGAIISGATSASYSVPVTTVSNSGNYTVEVTGECGTVASSGALLTVNPLPSATISGTTSVCQTGTVPAITFTGAGGTAPYTFTYKINGGAPQTVSTTAGNTATVTASLALTGNFVYELVSVKDASSTACTNTASGTATVTVTPSPSASITYGGTPFCKTGTAVPKFSGSATGTYTSTAGLNINATTGVIDLGASTPGLYTITYTIPGSGGCSQYQTTTAIEIKPTTFITTQPTAKVICSGTGVTFSVGATGAGLTYQWQKDGIDISGATSATYTITSATAALAGAYRVVINDGCTPLTSASATLTVNAAPQITSQPTAQAVCVGTPVTFSVNAAGAGLSYQWRKNSINITGANDATYTINSVTAADVASYDVLVSGTCGTTTSMAVNLTLTTGVTITTQPAAKVVCAGTPASFSVAASGTGISYQWRKGGMNITGATSATYSIATPAAGDAGSYDVVISGTCGSVTSSAAILTVNAIPATPTITAGGPITFCTGGSVTLSSSAATGNQWYKDGLVITGATSQTYSATQSGNYTVRTTQSACASPVSAVTTVTVNALPAVPTITATGNILSSSAASGNQWYLNGVAITGATGQTHRVQASGLYTVHVTQGTCSAISVDYNFVATRVEEPSGWNGEVTLYPNPVHKTLFIKNATGHKLQVQIYDGLGKKAHESQLLTTQGSIDMQGFRNGVYQLLITDVVTQKTVSQSIIKL